MASGTGLRWVERYPVPSVRSTTVHRFPPHPSGIPVIPVGRAYSLRHCRRFLDDGEKSPTSSFPIVPECSGPSRPATAPSCYA